MINQRRTGNMNIIYAEYNMYRNSIDVYTYAGYMLRIDCWKAEKNLQKGYHQFLVIPFFKSVIFSFLFDYSPVFFQKHSTEKYKYV